MSNLINNNFNNLKIKLNNDDYWDFFVCKDVVFSDFINSDEDNNCLISYIDALDEECIDEDWIKGKKNYTWNSANTTNYTLYNIGYTGFDNGLFSFRKDRIDNEDFLKLYQGTTFTNNGETSVLRLHKVSGSTLQYDYPTNITDEGIKLNGGFYQGYFETKCEEYKILPTTIDAEWNFEFQLKKSDLEKESSKTLNDKYPNNKGIFFYIGTRAENKWIYLYDDSESICDELGIGEYVEGGDIDTKNYGINNFLDLSLDLSKGRTKSIEDDYFEEIDILEDDNDDDCKNKIIENIYVQEDIDISDFDYRLDNCLKLNVSNQYSFKTDNKFLFFDRTCTGFTVDNWIGGTEVEFRGQKSSFKNNLFLLMNRTCTGYTVETIGRLKESANTEYKYNIYKDLYNNALAFRIKDDGSIGYKYYALDCSAETKCTLIEGYSKQNIIQNDKWYDINVKIDAVDKYKMKLYFYVNGKLKFISNELPMLDLRALNEIYEKQEGVPYNISLGGGTQGLAETILPNYMRNPYRTYPLEEYFSGTFIGYIKTFKFRQCYMKYEEILNNFKEISN